MRNLNQVRGLNGWGAVLLLALLALPELRAQATEGVMPVASGVWRVDAELWARGEDRDRRPDQGGRMRSEAWGWVDLATGVNDLVEARVSGQLYQRERVAGEPEASGVGDLYLAAKWRLAGDEATGPAWAFLPFVKLPTAGARWADDTVDAGAALIFGQPWGESGFFNAQVGLEDHGDGAGGRDLGAAGSVVAGRALGGPWTAYAEAQAALYPVHGDKRVAEFAVGGGLSWAGNEAGSWGLDLAAYGGLTRATTDFQAVLRAWVEWGGGR